MTKQHFYCTGFNASLTATHNKSKLIYRPRCKQWSCPYCAIQNMKLWRWRISKEIESQPDVLWWFWTITLAGADHKTSKIVEENIAHSMSVYRSKWDTLLKRIRRDMKKITYNFTYIRVFETHASGVIHAHMITNCGYADATPRKPKKKKTAWNSETLKKHLTDVGLGYVHDIKPIETKEKSDNGIQRNVSSYVTKYLTKDTQSFIRDALKRHNMGRVRIIQTSQNFFNENPTNSGTLEWTMDRIDRIEFHTDTKITEYKDISRDITVTDADFYEYSHYPNQKSDTLWRWEIEDSHEYHDSFDHDNTDQ